MQLYIMLFTCFVFITNSLLAGEEENIKKIPKWGKITLEEAAITSIPMDPEADAVILLATNEMEITKNFELVMTIRYRLKILTEQGKDYADVSISYWHTHILRKIKAHTILPNGKKIKVKSKDIFEKQDDSWKEKTFTFPGVEVGAILEYEYKKISRNLHFMEPWYFQGKEFMKYNRLTVILPSGFNYKIFYANVDEERMEPLKIKILQPNKLYLMKYVWQFENLPGIKSEPYMTTIRDYMAVIYFQLVSYQDKYNYYTYISTWEDLTKEVRDEYDIFIRQNNGLQEITQNLISGLADKQEKIIKLYNYVKDTITTTPYVGLIYNDRLKHPKTIYDSREGSRVEKNLLLLNLLNHAGIEAYPLLISTRDNGSFVDYWPKLTQFNRVIVYIPSYKATLLDAGSKYVPFGLLPALDLVDKGLVIRKTDYEIVNLPKPENVNMEYAETNAKLSAEGDMTCKTVLRYEDYKGVVTRSDLSDENDEDYIKELLQDRFEDVSIDSFKIHNLDNLETPLVIELFYTLPQYCQVVGDMMYLNPLLIHKIKSNPFKLKNRDYPVDYNFRRSYKEQVNIELPPGIKVIEETEPLKISNPEIFFLTQCEIDSNAINYNRQFMIKKNVVMPGKYGNLMRNYKQIVSSDQGQLVLKNPE